MNYFAWVSNKRSLMCGCWTVEAETCNQWPMDQMTALPSAPCKCDCHKPGFPILAAVAIATLCAAVLVYAGLLLGYFAVWAMAS